MILGSNRGLKYGAIVILCVLSYGDQLDGDFVFDDSAAISGNKQVSGGSLLSIFKHDYWGTPILSPTSHKSYRPFTTLTFRIEYQFHGREASPFWMKGTNLLLHILVCCYLLEFGDLFFRDKCRTSFLAALLFSVHPIHTEAVSGIVSRADLLATICCLVVIGIYFKAFIGKDYSIKLAVVQIVILFITGVLFKETAVTMLFSCAALDVLYHTDLITGRTKLQDWKAIPWRRILLLGVSGLLYIYIRYLMGTPHFQLEDNPIAVIKDRIFRIINQVFLHSINAWLLICPDWLSFDWSMGSVRIIESWTDYRLIGVFIHTFSLSCIVIRLATMNERRRRNQLITLLVLIVAPFLPASGIIHVGFVIAERLLYMPSVGWCLFCAAGFKKLLKWTDSKYCKFSLKSCFIFLLFVFIMKTRHRAAEWKHGLSLYESSLRVCPNNAKAYYNIGIATQGNPKRSITFYRHAISLYPDYDAALMNLGNVYRDQGYLEQAESFLRRALASIKIIDKRAAAEMNLGIVMVMKKQYNTALLHYNNALQARPYYPVCYYNMGNAYLELKQFDVAQKNFETAIALDRTMEVAWKNLLTLLYNERKYDEVIKTADEAQTILPNDMDLQFPKANALAKLKRNVEAEAVFLMLIEKRPGDAVYYANLGVLYHHWKRYDQAAFYYDKALTLNPALDRIREALDKVKRLNQIQ